MQDKAKIYFGVHADNEIHS